MLPLEVTKSEVCWVEEAVILQVILILRVEFGSESRHRAPQLYGEDFTKQELLNRQNTTHWKQDKSYWTLYHILLTQITGMLVRGDIEVKPDK